MNNFKAAFETLRQWYSVNTAALKAQYRPFDTPCNPENYRAYRHQKQLIRDRVNHRIEELRRRA